MEFNSQRSHQFLKRVRGKLKFLNLHDVSDFSEFAPESIGPILYLVSNASIKPASLRYTMACFEKKRKTMSP